MIPRHPVRILQIVGGMNHGGVETWLMHVLRHIDRRRFQMDFLVHTDRECVHDAEIRNLGSSLYYCPAPRNPLRYAQNFWRILRVNGPFDVIHSHMHCFSALPVLLARAAGVPTRIVHSHLDTRSAGEDRVLRNFYGSLSRRLIRRYGTCRLAVSSVAAESLFGPRWSSLAHTRVLYCGLDLAQFDAVMDRSSYRRQLKLSPDDLILAHVGRFVPQKNHLFLLDVLLALRQRHPRVKLLLIGEGPLRANVEERSRQLGIQTAVIFLGPRHDVPQILLGAADAFLLPSLFEGLPLSVVEAQLARIPVVMSDCITKEVDLGFGLVHQMDVAQGSSAWAERILSLPGNIHVSGPERSKAAARFDVTHCTEELSRCYLSRGNPGSCRES